MRRNLIGTASSFIEDLESAPFNILVREKEKIEKNTDLFVLRHLI